jgi:hypothetical protein
MHAVLVAVKINDEERALTQLREQVVPGVTSAPGFVNGVWLAPQNGRGYSTVVFESEEAAQAAAERIESPSDAVEIQHVEVVPVVAHA